MNLFSLFDHCSLIEILEEWSVVESLVGVLFRDVIRRYLWQSTTEQQRNGDVWHGKDTVDHSHSAKSVVQF